MKRLSAETFTKSHYGENTTAIRIKDGEFYWLCDIEEYEGTDCGLRIFAPYKDPILLDRNVIIVTGDLSVTNADAYESTRMTYYHETKDEEKECNIYERILSMIQPYTRNGLSDTDDYDIFLMTSDELSAISDALKDGDYIIILEH